VADLFASPEAGTHIGGPRARDELESAVPGEVELGYPFLPQARGRGYAAEACAAAPEWGAGVLPGEPVVPATRPTTRKQAR
jgi:hypothetical protein